jgi:hypothetical protein
MPPELIGKTIQQLKALGAEELGSFGFDPATRAMTELRSADGLSGIDRDEEARKSLRALDDDDFDSDHFLDDLQLNNGPFEEVTSLSTDRRTRKKQMDHLVMKRQHQIDQLAVKVVVRALQDGVALHGDPVYEEML